MRVSVMNTMSRYFLFAGVALLYYAHRVLSVFDSYEYVDATELEVNPLLLPVLLGSALCLAAGWPFLCDCVERMRSRLEDPGIERDLLIVAARSEGQVSSAEVALLSGHPLSAVNTHLRLLETRGLLNSTIDDRGATLYMVADMLPIRGTGFGHEPASPADTHAWLDRVGAS